jgi:hypothetical protein
MERETFKLLFLIRKNKLLKDGTAPILMRITVNRKRWDSALKVGVIPADWDQQKERAIGEVRYSNLVNERLRVQNFVFTK